MAFADFAVDREAVVERARAAGVEACVVVAVDAHSARQALELARTLPDWARPTAGLHPTEPATSSADSWPEIRELLESGEFVAVGETGLDAFHRTVPLDEQERSLRRHLDCALELSLPVVLHCREAFPALTAVLQTYRGASLRGVLHCYSGTSAQLAPLLEAGLHIGVGGMATYPKNSELRRAAVEVPNDRLLLETDAPWLSPQPVRGRRNEPGFVAHVNARIALERGVSDWELAAMTTRNARALFELR
ncbi:MAG: TatD family hydrolase [Planctomycetota bacterium]